MSAQHLDHETVFACNMNALTAAQREQHGKTSTQLFADVQTIRETPHGYAFRLPQEAATLARIADFITYERLCCPFFAFHVEVEPHGGAIWIELSGSEGVKAFIIAELGGLLNDDIAAAAGFRQSPA